MHFALIYYISLFTIYDHYEFHMAVVVGIQFFKGSVKIRMTDHVQRRNIQLLLREQFVFVGSMRRVIGNMQQEITSSPIKSLLL